MIRMPILPFSVVEFGINNLEFCRRLSPLFNKLSPDLYDVKKREVEILQRSPIRVPINMLRKYYEGQVGAYVFKESFDALPLADRREYEHLAPYRYRAISTFQVFFENGKPVVNRSPTMPFSQEEALISEEKVDVRKWNRVFPELSEEAAAEPIFHATIIGLFRRIHAFMPDMYGMNLIVHHVKVITIADQITTNSPEGVHQDGFPLIVSALVVDRRGVSGGESLIYSEDKKEPIFTTILQPGNGLLQPDLGSCLWHTVTPITGQGYRSSIGFDIQPLLKKKG